MTETNDGRKGGMLKGDAHSAPSGGMPAIVTNAGNKPVLLEGNEVIINKKSVADPTVKTITGTNKEILSEINQSGGGVPIMGKGGDVKVTEGNYASGDKLWRVSETKSNKIGVFPQRTFTREQAIERFHQQEYEGGGEIITPKTIQDVISGKIEVRHGAAIHAAKSYLEGSQRTDSNGKICKPQEGEEADRLKEAAKSCYFDPRNFKDYIDEGAEQKVYLIHGKRVLKLNNCGYYESWQDYLNSLLLHNYFFMDTAYDLVGFLEYKGKIYSVITQDYIKATAPTDLGQVQKFMNDNGFMKKNGNRNDYYNPELGIILEDLHDENVLTKDGVLYFIDTVFYLDKKMQKGGDVPKKLYGGSLDYFHPNVDDKNYKWLKTDKEVYSLVNKPPIKMSELISHDELFKKYPFIKNTKVYFEEIKNKFSCGELILAEDIYSDSETKHFEDYHKNCIYIRLHLKYFKQHGKEKYPINGKQSENSKEANLLHELQHVSQQADGREYGSGIDDLYTKFISSGKNSNTSSGDIRKRVLQLYINQPAEREASISVLVWLKSQGYYTKELFEIGGEVSKEAKEHAGTFEKIIKGEIKTAQQLGQSIVKEHKKSHMKHISRDIYGNKYIGPGKAITDVHTGKKYIVADANINGLSLEQKEGIPGESPTFRQMSYDKIKENFRNKDISIEGYDNANEDHYLILCSVLHQIEHEKIVEMEAAQAAREAEEAKRREERAAKGRRIATMLELDGEDGMQKGGNVDMFHYEIYDFRKGYDVNKVTIKDGKAYYAGMPVDDITYHQKGDYYVVSIIGKTNMKLAEIYLKKEDFKKIASIVNPRIITIEHLEKGGSIPNNYEGKTAEQVFNSWSIKQKEHFFRDHEDFLKGESFSDVRKSDWKDLTDKVKRRIEIHISEGQYGKGGEIEWDTIKDEVFGRSSYHSKGTKLGNYKYGTIVEYKGKYSVVLPGNASLNASSLEDAKKKIDDYTEKRNAGKMGNGGLIKSLEKKGIVKILTDKKNPQGHKIIEIIQKNKSDDGYSRYHKVVGGKPVKQNSYLTFEEVKHHLNNIKKDMMATGGAVDEEGVDLFEDYENIPTKVQKVLDKYAEGFEDGSYDELEKALSKLNAIGYTFDYDLDGQAYDLRKIGQKGKMTENVAKQDEGPGGNKMATGGKLGFKGLSKKIEKQYEKKGYGKKEATKIGNATAAKIERKKGRMERGGNTNSTLKTVMVFKDGELFKQIPYKTKTLAQKNYKHFKKNGIVDPDTGNKVENATFELL